jgi:hypothetical protein
MRQMLIAVLLLLTVVLLYDRIVGGEGGTRELVRESGRVVADEISRINP